MYTVTASYRDASRLIQRLKDKQDTSSGTLLPNLPTKDLEDSLSLGTIAVQSQYEHDVRRFGETYARGDAIAREQMKDILITLQQSIITHLREVYMDEATLDLHTLKETSEDSRVNATVCLGQLYQRMSTATAAMKQQIKSRPPYAAEADDATIQMPGSPAYSSGLSTHSSFGAGGVGGAGRGRAPDDQSTTSHTTYSSETTAVLNHQDRKSSGGGLVPQRRISLNSNSAPSHSSGLEAPQSVTPGEDNVPALPFSMERQSSQTPGEDRPSGATRDLLPSKERESSPNAPAPLRYNKTNLSTSMRSGEKGQIFPQESNFYRPPTPDGYHSPPQSPPLQTSYVLNQNQHELYLSKQPQTVHLYELEDRALPQARARLDQTPQVYQNQGVPLNPNYSTLEYVVGLEPRSRLPASPATSRQYQGYMQQSGQQWQPQVQQGYYQQVAVHGQQWPSQPIAWEQSSIAGPASVASPVDPAPRTGVSTRSSAPRPLSIRSSSSAGSKFGTFKLRRALPPGIADAIHKSAPSPTESRPRYIKPETADLEDKPPVKSSTRALTFPHVQIVRSALTLPNESNLAGFCKGAVRTQLGARKKGFSLQHKPKSKGQKEQEYVFRCTKCSFEGPAEVSTALPSGGRGAVKREKTFDARVRVSEGGIRYRWVFLAKSHVFNKGTASDRHNSNDVFGCYFCCAEGLLRGWVEDDVGAQLATLGSFGDKKSKAKNINVTTPTFTGLRAFLAHLETHRTASRTPGLIVANEMNCIVGRLANDSEDFDLNLPPPAALPAS